MPEVVAELDRLGMLGWRREIALALAEQMDSEPNASIARELRLLMTEIGAKAFPESKRGVTDELRSRRERRRFAASGS